MLAIPIDSNVVTIESLENSIKFGILIVISVRFLYLSLSSNSSSNAHAKLSISGCTSPLNFHVENLIISMIYFFSYFM